MDDASSIIPDDNHKHHHHHHNNNHDNHNNHNNIEQNQNQPQNQNQNQPHNQPTARARRFSLFDNVKKTTNAVLPIQDIHHNVDHSKKRSRVVEYFESIVEMVEPIEFYTVRQEVAPKAPSLIRVGIAFLLLFAAIIIFALVVSDSLQTFTVETDIFRKLPDPKYWDECEPITTLGSNWTPFTLYAKDTDSVQIRYDLHNMWFKNTTSCQDTLGSNWKKFCTLEVDGGNMSNNTGVGLVAIMPYRSYASAMCDGKNLNWSTRGTAADCISNHIEIFIKYWVPPTTGNYYTDCYGTDKRPGYIDMCSAIFDSTNPYKCTRKTYTSVVDSLSNGYAFATLAFTMAVITVTSIFPIFFRESHAIELES